jgi:hypothetical protein
VKEYLVITIDVECDYNGSPIWQYSDPLGFNAVLDGIPNRLQPMFNKYGARPTYLVANNVLEDSGCVEVLSSLKGRYELGAHLHGDFIEPQKRIFNYNGAKAWDNQYQYSREIEYGKMKNLTELFKRRFNRQPLSFRAGRFSAGSNTIQILSELGYKVDTTVTPNMVWKDRTRNLDFKRAPDQPYYPDPYCLTKEGHSDILEVPISLLKRPFFKPLWLRPTFSPLSTMIEIMKTYKERCKDRRYTVHNMMFHNVEIYPNASPYTSCEDKCQHYIRSIEAVLDYCASKKIGFITLFELYKLYPAARTPRLFRRKRIRPWRKGRG